MAVLNDYSGGVPADDVVALSGELAGHKEKMKSAQGKLRETRKRMEETGIDLKAYDDAQKLAKLDPAEAIARLNKTYFYLKAFRAPVGSQLNFIELVNDNSMTDEQRMQKWFDEGFLAGSTGKWDTDCPHAVNLPSGQQWLKGYREAQGILAAKFKEGQAAAEQKEWDGAAPAPAAAAAPAAPPEETAPRRRGRPPGSGKKGGVTITSQSGVTVETKELVPAAASGELVAPPAPPGAEAEAAPAIPDPDEMVPFDDAPPFDDPPAPPMPPDAPEVGALLN